MSKIRTIVSFISAKGGSGKTVTASSIGRFLARLDFRTLLVDTDAATNGLTLLFLSNVTGSKKSGSEDFGVFDVDETTSPKPVTIEDNLDLIPATYRMSQTEGIPLEKFSSVLDRIISQTKEYDIVLVDAQAGSDTYAKIAAGAADQVVIVTEFDPISLQGVDRLKILFSSVMDPRRTWVLYNKILPEFATAIGEGLIIAQILPPIPWDVEVIRAFAQRELAVNMERPNAYTISISQIVARLFGDQVKTGVAAWMSHAEEAKMRPVVSRLSELEKEIADLEKDKIATELKIRRARVYPVVLAGIGFATLAAIYPTLLRAITDWIDIFSDSKFSIFVRIYQVLQTPESFLIFVIVAVPLIMLIAWRQLGRSEQDLLVQQQFFLRRLQDINEERKRLKLITNATAMIDKPELVAITKSN